MVQIEAPSTPECEEGILFQEGQGREEHRVVHHVHEEHYYFKSKCRIKYIPGYKVNFRFRENSFAFGFKVDFVALRSKLKKTFKKSLVLYCST